MKNILYRARVDAIYMWRLT